MFILNVRTTMFSLTYFCTFYCFRLLNKVRSYCLKCGYIIRVGLLCPLACFFNICNICMIKNNFGLVQGTIEMEQFNDVVGLCKSAWYKLPCNLMDRLFALKLCFKSLPKGHEGILVAVTDTINLYIYDCDEDWINTFNVCHSYLHKLVSYYRNSIRT